jgi:hypothetical protein
MTFKDARTVLSQFREPSYWNRENTIEFFAFMTKLIIIIPGLLFGVQFWWLYIFALVSSAALIWSSTVKTLPTLIVFNGAWVCIAAVSIFKGVTS